MSKNILIISVIIFIALVVMAFKPISFSNVPEICNGKIISVSEQAVKDAVVKIESNENAFYINRGFEYFKTEDLKSLVGKSVSIYYSQGWTPLDPFNNRNFNIETLKINDSIFFQQ